MSSSNVSSRYEQLKAQEKRLIFEDAYCGVFLAEPPMTLGHVKIIAKQDGKFEELGEACAERMFAYATLCASALFELLQAQGTNILMDEWIREREEPHAIFHVIARYQEDDLNFFWEAQRMDDVSMEDAMRKVLDKAFLINYKEEKPELINLDDRPKPKKIERYRKKPKDEFYRIP